MGGGVWDRDLVVPISRPFSFVRDRQHRGSIREPLEDDLVRERIDGNLARRSVGHAEDGAADVREPLQHCDSLVDLIEKTSRQFGVTCA